jgi:hypothetical protein
VLSEKGQDAAAIGIGPERRRRLIIAEPFNSRMETDLHNITHDCLSHTRTTHFRCLSLSDSRVTGLSFKHDIQRSESERRPHVLYVHRSQLPQQLSPRQTQPYPVQVYQTRQTPTTPQKPHSQRPNKETPNLPPSHPRNPPSLLTNNDLRLALGPRDLHRGKLTQTHLHHPYLKFRCED